MGVSQDLTFKQIKLCSVEYWFNKQQHIPNKKGELFIL